MFGQVIGNWAERCSEDYGITQATWYYTAATFKDQNKRSYPARCAWIDRDGDQPTTGIQINWPRYNGASIPANTVNAGQFCNDNTVLNFHTDADPNYVVLPGNLKRDDRGSDVPATSRKERRALSDQPQKSGSSYQFASQLVKSWLTELDATYLCQAKASAGPSFVSHTERMFCHMPTKQLFPFCEDVTSGACWSEDLSIVTPKLVDALVPAINFTVIDEWTNNIEL